MNWFHLFVSILTSIMVFQAMAEGEPRIFIRAGAKTHGLKEHDHPRFLEDWKELLSSRGMQVAGSLEFPTIEQLAETDVLIIYAADGMNIVGEARKRFESYLRRGGGVVVIHDGIVSGDQNIWCKKVVGGAWVWGDKGTQWLHGDVGLYFVNDRHPVVKGISNFDWRDEIYFSLDMSTDVDVLATSFHSVFVIAPQIWTYEKTWDGGHKPYRAFVSLPGHYYDVFNTPHYRAILLRGIAWTLRRSDVDEFCAAEEINSLTYPVGGPIHPDRTEKKFDLHPDFEISLVASEPEISNVLSLDWAPDGKLWVVESPEYPNGRKIHRSDDPIYPERARHPSRNQGGVVNRPAYDRVSWLEDSDGDGRYDSRRIFADYQHGVPGGLELVTSFVFHKDGVIVAQAPDILWLRDTNADGVCDKVETLYSDFGNHDSHAVMNNFRWGHDGWIYGAIGYSAGTPISQVTNERFDRVTAGVFRFKADGSAVEQVASGSCNTWGFDFAPNGEQFFTTATCGQHFLHVVMPEKFLARANVGGVRAYHVVPDHQNVFPARTYDRPAYVQIDWVGSFTAAAGSCIYNGGAWPEEYTGSHFVSEPTVNLLHHEIVQSDGVTFTAHREKGREETEFLRGTDLWFRPVHQRVGPDGAVYLVDFYNQAAIHNDTRGPDHGAHNAATRPDRDHKFARIYRIQHRESRTLKIPRLDGANERDLVRALKHANGWTRDTAARLLRESGGISNLDNLTALVNDASVSAPGRIAALWTLETLGSLDQKMLGMALNDNDPVLRQTVLRIVANRENSGSTAHVGEILERVEDADSRARLNALMALSSFDLTAPIARKIVTAWPSFTDPWTKSAALGVAANSPVAFMRSIFQSEIEVEHASLVRHVARMVAEGQNAEQVVSLITDISNLPSIQNRLKIDALNSLVKSLPASVVPNWTAELRQRLTTIISADEETLVNAALPLIARWDSTGDLSDVVVSAISRLRTKLESSGMIDSERVSVAATLLGVRRYDPAVVHIVGNLLDGELSIDSKSALVDALGSVTDQSAGNELLTRFSDLPLSLQDRMFGHVIKRVDWTQQLLNSLAEKQIALTTLGPVKIHQLRTHANGDIAERAIEVVETLRGPDVREKDQLIARFSDAVLQPGDLNAGRELYVQNCSICHRFQGEGADLAPDLTGMGAHGPLDLLMHIIDPNRVVEPNFLTTSVETEDDQVIDGIVESENRSVLTIRNVADTYEVRKDNILSRRSTGLSLMPNGYEALGGKGLRDLIGYLCADEGRYRIINLSDAYTASSTEGLFASRAAKEDTIQFSDFGLVRIDGIPFDIVDPLKSSSGKNVIVLKGGLGFSKTLPQSVTFPVGVTGSRLHVLGGVGGWAWPHGGDQFKDIPVSKLTFHFSDGKTEEKIFRNGVEFTDYSGSSAPSGSLEANGLVHSGQLRWFTVDIDHDAVIESITLESYDNRVAPTFVGLTVEMR